MIFKVHKVISLLLCIQIAKYNKYKITTNDNRNKNYLDLY